MSAYQQLNAVTFESKVKTLSQQVVTETQGELELVPVDCGHVELFYKGGFIARLHIAGLKKKDVLGLIVQIFKACIFFHFIEQRAAQ